MGYTLFVIGKITHIVFFLNYSKIPEFVGGVSHWDHPLLRTKLDIVIDLYEIPRFYQIFNSWSDKHEFMDTNSSMAFCFGNKTLGEYSEEGIRQTYPYLILDIRVEKLNQPVNSLYRT